LIAGRDGVALALRLANHREGIAHDLAVAGKTLLTISTAAATPVRTARVFLATLRFAKIDPQRVFTATIDGIRDAVDKDKEWLGRVQAYDNFLSPLAVAMSNQTCVIGLAIRTNE